MNYNSLVLVIGCTDCKGTGDCSVESCKGDCERCRGHGVTDRILLKPDRVLLVSLEGMQDITAQDIIDGLGDVKE